MSAYRESTSTPWRTAVYGSKVGELLESSGVTERNVDETVVGEGAHGSDGSGFLTSSETRGGNEDTSVLASE